MSAAKSLEVAAMASISFCQRKSLARWIPHVKTLGDLCQLTRQDLLMTPKFGIGTVDKIEAELESLGLKLSEQA